MRRLAVLVSLFALNNAACTCGAPKVTEVPDAGCEATNSCPCVPQPETCNGKDDDCNGLIDDGLGTISCGIGGCANTVNFCQGGQVQTCTPGMPQPEVCNGIDDDCNGAVDENLMPTMCGLSVCATVSPSCAMGAPVTCMPLPGSAEICNGIDDNCDGTVDEGLLSNTSGDMRLTNDPASSDYVYLGKGGNGFGLVWQDKRTGKGQIFFAPLDLKGARQAASDVRVSTTTGSSEHPALDSDGTSWGVVYSDSTTPPLKLFFQKVDLTGVLQGNAVQITNSIGESDWPDIVWDGTNYAVAYDDSRLGAQAHDIFFQKLDSSGQKVGPEVRITTDPARQSSPILKWNGTEYGIAWTDYRFPFNREIYFARLDASGAVIGTEVRVTNDAADSAWPDLAWNTVDKQWALVWHDTRDGNDEIYFARLDAMGTKLGADVRLTNAANFSGFPSIDWNGSEYGVSWQDERTTVGKPAIYFAQVSAAGVKTSPEFLLSSGTGSSTFTTALWNGQTYAFAWKDDRDGPTGNTELYFAYVGCPH
jgi:hypothetical protein